MKPKSHTLFHFTKSRDVLKLVLKNGFWPRYCLEDIKWVGQEGAPYIAYPMVCFCDIPLSRIEDHIAFYGNFGLGMTKEWAESNGLNPVMYLSSGNNVSQSFNDLNTHANKLTDADVALAKINMRYLFAHAKPLEGNMLISGEPKMKEFYQESEWRYVPKNESIEEYLKKSEYDDEKKLEESNNATKEHCLLKFSPKDIKYIFVKSDTDIPDIINFIQTEMDHYPGVDTKILMSRVTSLESISHDV